MDTDISFVFLSFKWLVASMSQTAAVSIRSISAVDPAIAHVTGASRLCHFAPARILHH